ncbi:MAG: M23 family metallopeptidase [Magnetococcales bacterium]|nr:M23 family metallopeptidase [Magnetococcales bacterium]
MPSLYSTPATFGNQLFQAFSIRVPTLPPGLLDKIPLRIFTLLLPATLGSLLVVSWLESLSPESPVPGEMAHASAPSAPLPEVQRIDTALRGGDAMLPNLESLEGLFAPQGSKRQLIPADKPAAKTANPSNNKGLSRLESQINEVLLEHLDPFVLNREQKQIFMSSIPTGFPLTVMKVNSPYGYRIHPTLHTTRFHPGVDLHAAMNTPVMATADGVVELAGLDNNKFGLHGYGQVICIYHNFGFRTTYSHLNKTLVRAGDFVKKGDVIGLSGKSGLVTAPHLHYEVRFIHQYLNPAPFMNWTQDRYEALFREKNVQWRSLIELIGLRLPKKPSENGSMRIAMKN